VAVEHVCRFLFCCISVYCGIERKARWWWEEELNEKSINEKKESQRGREMGMNGGRNIYDLMLEQVLLYEISFLLVWGESWGNCVTASSLEIIESWRKFSSSLWTLMPFSPFLKPQLKAPHSGLQSQSNIIPTIAPQTRPSAFCFFVSFSVGHVIYSAFRSSLEWDERA
jgi:hypothetical protein